MADEIQMDNFFTGKGDTTTAVAWSTPDFSADRLMALIRYVNREYPPLPKPDPSKCKNCGKKTEYVVGITVGPIGFTPDLYLCRDCLGGLRQHVDQKNCQHQWAAEGFTQWKCSKCGATK